MWQPDAALFKELQDKMKKSSANASKLKQGRGEWEKAFDAEEKAIGAFWSRQEERAPAASDPPASAAAAAPPRPKPSASAAPAPRASRSAVAPPPRAASNITRRVVAPRDSDAAPDAFLGLTE